MVRLPFWGSDMCAVLIPCLYSQVYSDLEWEYLLESYLWSVLKLFIFVWMVQKKKKKKGLKKQLQKYKYEWFPNLLA